jgi:hypothetical protein
MLPSYLCVSVDGLYHKKEYTGNQADGEGKLFPVAASTSAQDAKYKKNPIENRRGFWFYGIVLKNHAVMLWIHPTERRKRL